VLTLMPGEEMENNRVTAMPALCEALELSWFHLPVEDDAGPEAAFEQAWLEARDQVRRCWPKAGMWPFTARGARAAPV
jgi:hypothetical protein